MNKKLFIYISLISIVGIGAFIYSIFQYSIYLKGINNIQSEMIEFLILVFLSALCRSLPVRINQDREIDVSIITIYASLLLKGVYISIIILVLSSLITVEKVGKGQYRHILNVPFYKTIFNISNLVLSITIGGMVFSALQGHPGNITFPGILIPSLGFIMVMLILNFTILCVLIYFIHNNSFLQMWKEGIITLLPNMFTIAPLGYFMAVAFTLDGGQYVAILFFIPLLFARYAFKLYLDSKNQYYKTIKTLTAAIEAKDKYTEGHSRRVEMYAEKIAQAMNLSNAKVESIKVAALLHDIGKIGIEDAILRKPDPLSSDEWAKIEEHPKIGIKILEDVEFPDNIKDFILHHHEKYDGTGYPGHIKGTSIPLEAAILSAADAYDAMTSDRPYRKAFSKEKAVQILKEDAGVHFHPKVIEIFIKVLHEE